MEKFKKNYAIISISFTYFFFEITMYQIVQPIGLQKYWIVIPIFVYVISMIYKTFNEKDKIYDISIELLNIFALVIFLNQSWTRRKDSVIKPSGCIISKKRCRTWITFKKRVMY